MSNPNEVNVRISVEASESTESCDKDCCKEASNPLPSYVVATTYGKFFVEDVASISGISGGCLITLFAEDHHILACFDYGDVLYILDADKVSELYDDPCEDCEGPCCCEVDEDSREDPSENN